MPQSIPRKAEAALNAHWADSIGSSIRPGRRAITTQLREHCETNGLTYQVDNSGGNLIVVINGTRYTPGEAADVFLPAGFTGSFGST